MNFSHFFIDRPRFAAVLSILITIVGVIAYFGLPVTQYHECRATDDHRDCQLPGCHTPR